MTIPSTPLPLMAPRRLLGACGGPPLVLAALAVFAYTAWFRIHGIESTFMLLADQIRDWNIALGRVSDLPLTGPPSVAGGRSLGPVYYWVLWVSRVTIGPWVDNLPHAGGIGLSLLQSAADVALLVALRKRLGGLPVAIATVLLIATSPFEAAITASIWNPQVAVAFVKITMALVLLDDTRGSRRRQAVTATAAWLAVQAHSTAIFVSVPVLGWLVLRHLARRHVADAVRAAVDLCGIVAVLQVPFFLQHLIYGAKYAGGPARAIGAMSGLVAPGIGGKLLDSAATLSRFTGGTLVEPWRPPWVGVVLTAAAAVVIARSARNGHRWICITVVPLALAIVGYAPLAERSDYWYLALAPAAAASVALGVATWTSQAWRRWAGWLALAAIVVAQPARFDYSRKLGRMPEYGTMVTGARQIVRDGVKPRSVGTLFRCDGSDPGFVVLALGGQLDRTSRIRAEILPNGGVRYRTIPE